MLEPGIDGEALTAYGPDLANKRAREARWRRLQRAIDSFLGAGKIERGQVWQERRRPPSRPCLDSGDVNRLFANEGEQRVRVRLRRVDAFYAYVNIISEGRLGQETIRIRRDQLRRDYRRIE